VRQDLAGIDIHFRVSQETYHLLNRLTLAKKQKPLAISGVGNETVLFMLQLSIFVL